MRVDPTYTANLVSALDQAQASSQQLTSELSSGLRVTSLSVDPLAGGQNVRLLNQIQQDDSFTQTSSQVTGQLQVADSALGQVVSQLTEAISLATSADNGTGNATDRQAIANQITGIRDEVMGLANTSYQGQFLFAGTSSSTRPFSLDSTTSPPTVTYNGALGIQGTTAGTNFLESPNGQNIALNVPGNLVFGTSTSNDVFAALNNLIADYSSSNFDGKTAVADTQSLSSALSHVSEQRVTLDDSITQLTAASDAATSEATQLTASQTNLMQADVAQVATQLSLSQVQQTALESVITQLSSSTLFDHMQG